MQGLKQFFNLYLNSSIHVALSVYSLSRLTLLEFGLPYNEAVLYFVFYATITGYNFVKYYGLAKFHHISLTKRLQLIQLFSLACFVLMCYYGYQLSVQILWVVIILALITFFYAIPFLPKQLFVDRNHSLRSITGLKIYLIALVWMVVTVVLPLYTYSFAFDNDVLMTLIQRFMFVVVLMLPFEIRDLKYDSVKLSTVPQKIGVKHTKLIGIGLLLLFFGLEFFKSSYTVSQLIILAIITITTAVLLLFSKKEQDKYYSGLFVEAIPMMWMVLVLSFR